MLLNDGIQEMSNTRRIVPRLPRNYKSEMHLLKSSSRYQENQEEFIGECYFGLILSSCSRSQ